MTYLQLIEYFQNNSNKSYEQFSNTIVNSSVPMLGCSTPIVRKVAKQVSIEEAIAFPTHEYYEVDLLKGIVISGAKLHFEQKSKLLTQFADTIENWAVCDCSVVKFPHTERKNYFDYFVSLTQSDKVFVCRYGIVNLMSSFLREDYIDRVFDIICDIKLFGEYYVDMGIAWLIASAMAKCRDKTVCFMEGKAKKCLSKFCYNKALQKIRDSFRVSHQDKQWTYTQKMV